MDQPHQLLYMSTAGLSERRLYEMRNLCCLWISLGVPVVIDAELRMRVAQLNLELQVCQGKRAGEGL
jgi:hypothetical protein